MDARDGAVFPELKVPVRRIVALRKNAAGEITSVTVYRSKPAKKKGTTLLRPVEKLVDGLAEAHLSAAATYVARHRRSNELKKDGWLADLPENTFKAVRRGNKKIISLIRP